MTAVGMLAIGAGVLLIWAGVKNEDPRDVIGRILSGQAGTSRVARVNTQTTAGPGVAPGSARMTQAV